MILIPSVCPTVCCLIKYFENFNFWLLFVTLSISQDVAASTLNSCYGLVPRLLDGFEPAILCTNYCAILSLNYVLCVASMQWLIWMIDL